MSLNNYITTSKARVKSDKNTSTNEMSELLELARKHLQLTGYYRAKANLNGIAVELITNSAHQYEFWLQNWWPPSAGTLPHGRIFSVSGMPDHEPYAYYNPETHTALFINTEYYGQCKSWALGLAAAIFEKQYNTLSIHGALATLKGRGVVIVAPTGTGKTTMAFMLFLHSEGRIVGDDWVYITLPEETPANAKPPLVGVQPEKSLYMRSETEKDFNWLRPIFDQAMNENVVMNKVECEFTEGPEGCKLTGRKCVFNDGKQWCYYSFPNARSMVPREKLLGPDKVADKANIDLIVLLRRDNESPAEVRLTPDEAIRVLREGRFMIRPGAGPREMWGKMGAEPYYNPYLLELNYERQDRFWLLMFEEWGVKSLLLNTGVEKPEQTHQRIVSALNEGK